MNLVNIDIIAGARPNFMKIAPIINAIKSHQAEGGNLRFRLVHTGQHYDKKMSGDFFSQLGIPLPDVDLGSGSGTQAEQTAAILIRYEELLSGEKPDLCLVVGDVTSTMACAITAQKMGVSVAHVEAGIRSGDWDMPEEINRLVTDAITNIFFTTSELASQNLIDAGSSEDDIYFVGNTMIDTLLANVNRFCAPEFWGALGLKSGQYLVLTLHRPGNVDDYSNFENMLRIICTGSRNVPIVFPVHPRTAKTLSMLKGLPENLHFVEPLPYLEFNYLVQNSKGVITDSGGITEECTVMKIPCMTLRDTTERPETVTMGTNELIGTDPNLLKPALDRLFEGKWKGGSIPDKWDGKTGTRIVTILASKYNNGI